MNVPEVVMLATGVVGGAAALLVVTSRNVVHSALYLVVALLAVAGVFLVLGAEFVAWAQVLVYVGAVVVLLLFGLMLTRAPIGPTGQGNELGKAMPLAVALAVFAGLVALIVTSYGGEVIALEHVPPAALGEVLYVAWALPFMTLGFLLTLALIGAVVIARREEGEGPLPEPDPDEPEAAEASPPDSSSWPQRQPEPTPDEREVSA